MKDHYDSAVNPRDLTKRLNRISKSHSTPNNGDHIARLPRLSRDGAPTSSSSPTASLSRLPPFTKSSTVSTTSSSDSHTSRFGTRNRHSYPVARETKVSAEVPRGEFSKPRAGSARRRESSSSDGAKSVPEFQYYGRHANTWLFNGWSFSGSVKRGFGKVFNGGDDR